MIKKKLILFMPFMGGGGVEKNLLIISEFLSKKYNNLYVCTCSKKFRRKFNKNIKFISTNSDLNNKVKFITIKNSSHLFPLEYPKKIADVIIKNIES